MTARTAFVQSARPVRSAWDRASAMSYARRREAARQAAQAAVQRAQAAVASARSHADEMPPSSLSDMQRTIRRRLITSLGRAERGERGGVFEDSWTVVYEEAGKALRQLERLEGTGLDSGQRMHVAEAIAALHRAEDEVRDLFWHGI